MMTTETKVLVMIATLLVALSISTLGYLYVKRRYGWEDDDMPFIY